MLEYLEKKGLKEKTAKTEVLVSLRRATKSKIKVMDKHGEKLDEFTEFKHLESGGGRL